MLKLLVLLLAAAVTACAGAGVGSGSPTPNPQLPGITPALASYNVKVEFGGSLIVYWGWEVGNEGQNCAMWAAGGGVNKFEARSIKPALGRLSLSGPSTKKVVPKSWASFSVLGKAKGRAEKSITVHAGGVNWSDGCYGTRPRRPSSIDCGEREFAKMTAALYAVDGLFSPTFDPPETPRQGEDADLSLALIRFTIAPAHVPFGSCGIPDYAEQHLLGLQQATLRVTERERDKLRTLARGKSLRLADHYGGRCYKNRPARDCAFVLDLWLELTRVS